MASRTFHSATPSGVRARPRPVRDRAARGRWLVRIGEGLAYSSGLPALAGGAMTWAVGLSLAAPAPLRDAALVACGAFVIYGVDRLRDVAQDRRSAPDRTAFVLRRRRPLAGATGLAALALIALLATTPAAGVGLVLAVGSIGLLHRRMKRDVRVKIAYVAAAWTAACVGLPWLGLADARFGDRIGGGIGAGLDRGGPIGAGGEALAWAILAVGAAVTSNLIASNLRDGKPCATGGSPRTALGFARVIAIAGLALVLIAPEPLAALAWIPAAELVALFCFRPSERFGHLAVDGALALGALVAIGAVHG